MIENLLDRSRRTTAAPLPYIDVPLKMAGNRDSEMRKYSSCVFPEHGEALAISNTGGGFSLIETAKRC